MISFEDFQKLDMRIGKVISAEKIPNSDKLLKFIFDIGGEQRQILAGIAEFYPDPSILVGKEIPLLLNIEPRTFRGQISDGMIIAVDLSGQPIMLFPEKEIPPGSKIK